VSGGWQEVMRCRGPCRPASPAGTLPPRPISAWLFGRCFRCLVYGNHVADCRDPLRCSHCLENGHRAREWRNPWRPISSLSCLVTPPVSCHSVEHRPVPASSEGLMRFPVPSKAPCSGCTPSDVAAPDGFVALSSGAGWELSCAGGGYYEQAFSCASYV
jgi:hypothetical protein